MKDIDIVVPWVDGSDPVWQQERSKYLKTNTIPSGFYQDWGLMRYWFRGVEKNLPWVRYVFFVTYGHLPPWLNVNHPKLKIVNHKDFIPEEFLPTYSSVPINFNVHRIKGLSETFIYSEDDIFYLGCQEPENFFSKDGLPKDYIWLKPCTDYSSGSFAHILLSCLLVLKKHFRLAENVEKLSPLLFSKEYPAEEINDNEKYKNLKYVPGLKAQHCGQSYLKSTFEEVWEKEPMTLYEASLHKFRLSTDPMMALIRYWQLMSGKFNPYYPVGRVYTDTSDLELRKKILDLDTKVICINESEKQSYTEERAQEIRSYLEQRLPEKSSFEL